MGHRHRCVPAAVLPFFTSGAPHTRQRVEFDEIGTLKHPEVYQPPIHTANPQLHQQPIHTFCPITRFPWVALNERDRP